VPYDGKPCVHCWPDCGILATVTMDVVAVIALRLGIAGRGPRRTGPDLIGRWIGYLLRPE
jgi:anaerobic selenocysteine-containing dehydrogenase